MSKPNQPIEDDIVVATVPPCVSAGNGLATKTLKK